jgi:hypothetical protein
MTAQPPSGLAVPKGRVPQDPLAPQQLLQPEGIELLRSFYLIPEEDVAVLAVARGRQLKNILLGILADSPGVTVRGERHGSGEWLNIFVHAAQRFGAAKDNPQEQVEGFLSQLFRNSVADGRHLPNMLSEAIRRSWIQGGKADLIQTDLIHLPEPQKERFRQAQKAWQDLWQPPHSPATPDSDDGSSTLSNGSADVEIDERGHVLRSGIGLTTERDAQQVVRAADVKAQAAARLLALHAKVDRLQRIIQSADKFRSPFIAGAMDDLVASLMQELEKVSATETKKKRVEEKAAELERMKKALEGVIYEAIEIRGDGNCFYNAFLVSLLHYRRPIETIRARFQEIYDKVLIPEFMTTLKYVSALEPGKERESTDCLKEAWTPEEQATAKEFIKQQFEKYIESQSLETMKTFFNHPTTNLFLTFALRNASKPEGHGLIDNPECHGNDCDGGHSHMNMATLFERPFVVLQRGVADPWLVIAQNRDPKPDQLQNISRDILLAGPVVLNTGGHYNAIYVSNIDAHQRPEGEMEAQGGVAGAGAGSAAAFTTPSYPKTREAVRVRKRSPPGEGLPGADTPGIGYLTAQLSPTTPWRRMRQEAAKGFPALVLKPHVYQKGRGFDVLINEPAHANSLFIFNDNEEAFLAFMRGEPAGIKQGGGNAVIRPYRDPKRGRVRAAGIPTGRSGRGYAAADEAAGKQVIGRSLEVIWNLLTATRAEGNPYDALIYSADPENTEALGVGIFKDTMAAWVAPYVMENLRAIVAQYNEAREEDADETFED